MTIPNRTLSIVGLIAGLATSAQAATVASWDFTSETTGTTTGFASDVNPSIVLNSNSLDTGITDSMFATSTAGQDNPDYTHDGRGFHTTHQSLSNSLPTFSSDYLGFQVTVAEAYSFTSLSYDFGADNISNSNGSRVRFSLFVQVDGGGFTEIGGSYDEMQTKFNSTTNRYNIASFTRDLSALGSFSGGEVVDFRLAFADSGSAKTDRFAFIDNIVLENSVIPEPSSYALIGGLLALGSVMMRRRS